MSLWASRLPSVRPRCACESRTRDIQKPAWDMLEALLGGHSWVLQARSVDDLALPLGFELRLVVGLPVGVGGFIES
jgi:hypothetical protein